MKNLKNFNKEKIKLKLKNFFIKLKIFYINSKNKIYEFFKTLNWNLFLFTAIFLIIITLILANITYLIWVKKYDYVKVPNLQKKYIIEAILELQKYDLYPKIETIYSNESYGYIISQNPQPGKLIKNKRFVRLLVSMGPFVKTLEDFTGKSQFYVEKKLNEISSLTNKNIIIKNIFYQFSDNIPKGLIISQDPPAGTDLFYVNEISITISKGSITNDITLIQFTGLTLEEAIQKSKEIGVLLKIEYIPTEKPEEFGIVLNQNVPPGEIVKPNDEIIIYVGKRKE